MHKSNRGFTLIEITVVVGIIAVLATTIIISLQSARVKARDARRISDFNSLSTALLQYYQRNSFYPTAITPGQPIISPSGQTTYLDAVPSNPEPQNDEGCPNKDYSYGPSSTNASFALTSCIGKGATGAEIITLTPEGIIHTPQPYGWWTLDEGDGSAASNNGGYDISLGLSGGYAWEPAENCRMGICISFDGSTGNGSFMLPNLSSYTVATWVKRLSDQETEAGKMDETQIFASAGDQVGLTIKYYSPSNTTDTQFLFWDGTSIVSTSQVDLDTFYHVAITSDGNTKKLYVNGVVEASGSATNSMQSGTAKVAEGFGGSRNLNAVVDDFRVFNRALSEQEIQDIFRSAN